MKKTKIIYWIFTGLFAALMLFSAIPDMMVVPEAIEIMSGQLGYPIYLIPFIGVAKLLGAIAILVPGFPRLKEWAYAGLVFDLIGATYSEVASGHGGGEVAFMLLPFTLVFGSYMYYHKRLKEESAAKA
jgi:hypothetical protein